MYYRYQISYWFRFGDDSFLIITFLLSLRHGFRAILRAGKADIEQIQKVVPFITLLKITLKCLSLRVVLDLLIKF